MSNRRDWRLINVQTLIPTLRTRNGLRSKRASPMRGLRKRTHRHGPSARSSDLSLESSEALSENDSEINFRSTKRYDVLSLPHIQDVPVEQTDEIVIKVSVSSNSYELQCLLPPSTHHVII